MLSKAFVAVSKQLRCVPARQARFLTQAAQQIQKTRASVEEEFESKRNEINSVTTKNISEEMRLNHSLLDNGITPLYYVHRNATTEELSRLTHGKISKTEALEVQDDSAAEFELLSFNGKQGKQVSEVHARRIKKEITYHLSVAPHVYVQDSVYGAHRSVGVPYRVITDSAVAALFLKNMTQAIPLSKPKAAYTPFPSIYVGNEPANNDPLYKPVWTVLHAPGYTFPDTRIIEEFYGPTRADVGITGDQFVLVDNATNTIVIAGVMNTKLLREAMAFLGTKTAAENTLPLSADSLITPKGEVVVVFGNTHNDVAGILGSDEAVYGAHNNVWSEDGLSRVWAGVSTESSAASGAQRGHIVEHLAGNTQRHTRHVTGVKPNLVKHPKALVFISDKASADAGVVSPTDAKRLFAESLSASPFGALPSAEQEALFEKLVAASGAAIYSVNSSKAKDTVASIVKNNGKL